MPVDPRLVSAKARLDALDYYPRPVRIEGVHLIASAIPFKLPWLRSFDGWATHRAIFVKRPELLDDTDLITHELCHVWQMQHRPVRMPWSYLWSYEQNPYEKQARRAAAATRQTAPPSCRTYEPARRLRVSGPRGSLGVAETPRSPGGPDV